MDNGPLVSIIVPIFNVERYLEKCVSSLLLQTYKNIEIILVDDGSTDGSGVLCDRFEGIDARIRVVHKANGGLSDARNNGLMIASGEWVSFVDGDDWVSTVFIEALLRAALDSRCDIAAVPFGKPFRDGDDCTLEESLVSVAPARLLTSHCVQQLMLYQELDTGAPWRLYKKKLLSDTPFPVGLYYEDLACIYKIIHLVDRVAVLDCRDLYAYRMRKDSIIRQNYQHIKAESALVIADQLYRDITLWYPDLAVAAASRCFSVCRMVYAQIPIGRDSNGGTRRDRALLYAILVQHRKTILHDPRARKRERFAAAVTYFGQKSFDLFCKSARLMGLLR